MTADDIRSTPVGYPSSTDEMLREIAAQLAEHNAHLARIEWLAENVISLNQGGLQVRVNNDR